MFVTLVCSCFTFEDKEFPHTDASIGNIEGDTVEGGKYSGGNTSWVRVKELDHFKDKQPYLFFGDICPNDIFQGGLGDCWLMAAIACVAE